MFLGTFDPLVNDDDVCRNYLAVKFYTQCSRQNVFSLHTCPPPINWASSVSKILGKARGVWWDKKGFLISRQKLSFGDEIFFCHLKWEIFLRVFWTPSGNFYFLALVRWKYFHKAFFARLPFCHNRRNSFKTHTS